MPHIPVMMKEVLEFLNPQPGQNFVDCTLGDGGHATAILERTGPDGKLLGIDLDPAAIEVVSSQESVVRRLGERLIVVNDNFKNIASIVTEQKFGPVHGVLLDLGFSSSTLERGRGFSFDPPSGGDEPLDMRFNPTSGMTAAKIINSWTKEQIQEIFTEYGEEPLAQEIAETIVMNRKQHPIYSSKDLSEIILEVYRWKLKSKKEVPWIGGLHPATRVFQALRIAVNEELQSLQEVLPKAIEVLVPGGRLAVMAFHSLEDRIVKYFFKNEDDHSLKIITKKPVTASDGENTENPKARSAKLRIAEKIM